MIYLKCTNRVLSRARIKKENVGTAEGVTAVLGNWCVSIFEVDETNVLLYMSERSLLSFVMTEGERIDAVKLTTCFVRGLIQLLEIERFSKREIEIIVSGCEEGLIAGMDDLSVAGTLTNLGWDYRGLIENEGGLKKCNLGAIIMHLNAHRRKRLGNESPVTVARSLVSSAAT